MFQNTQLFSQTDILFNCLIQLFFCLLFLTFPAVILFFRADQFPVLLLRNPAVLIFLLNIFLFPLDSSDPVILRFSKFIDTIRYFFRQCIISRFQFCRIRRFLTGTFMISGCFSKSFKFFFLFLNTVDLLRNFLHQRPESNLLFLKLYHSDLKSTFFRRQFCIFLVQAFQTRPLCLVLLIFFAENIKLVLLPVQLIDLPFHRLRKLFRLFFFFIQSALLPPDLLETFFH